MCSAILALRNLLCKLFFEESALVNLLGQICSDQIGFIQLFCGISIEKSVLRNLLWNIRFEISALTHLLGTICSARSALTNLVWKQKNVGKVLWEICSEKSAQRNLLWIICCENSALKNLRSEICFNKIFCNICIDYNVPRNMLEDIRSQQCSLTHQLWNI